MAQNLRRPGQLETGKIGRRISYPLRDLDDVVEVALGVDSPGQGQSHILGGMGPFPHSERSQSHRADPTQSVEGAGERLSGIMVRIQVR